MSSSWNNKLCLSLNELEPDLVDVVESVAESVIVKGRLEVVAKSVAVFRKLNSVTLASSVVAKGKGGVRNNPPVFNDVRRMKRLLHRVQQLGVEADTLDWKVVRHLRPSQPMLIVECRVEIFRGTLGRSGLVLLLVGEVSIGEHGHQLRNNHL